MILPNYSFEMGTWEVGKVVAGVDEAGRGPLAGPVVAAAVILPRECWLDGLDDSKKLSPEKRDALFIDIKKVALSIGVGAVESEEIDRINILRASLLAMEMAVNRLGRRPDTLLVDGNRPIPLLIPQITLIDGDSICCSIAAASIIAKVTRDLIMSDYHAIYPAYNFKRHKGYPTKEHLEAIRKFGPCAIHRRTFRGVV